jgi:hypothetical protein
VCSILYIFNFAIVVGAKGYHMMVLTRISLMTNNIMLLFLCLFASHKYFVMKYVFKTFGYALIKWIIEWQSSLYIIDADPLADMF